MANAAQIIGGAGTGKTTELLRLMDMTMTKLVNDPMRIGFVSFTRAARREASIRAAEKFGLEADDLETKGWFRTLHSICYRVLRVSGDELITDTKDNRKWLEDAIGEPVKASTGSKDQTFGDGFETSQEADKALALWGMARNRLEPLSVACKRASRLSDNTPDYGYCAHIVKRYEAAKAKDGRYDFTSILERVAGYRHHIDGVERVTPEGDMPAIPVWFFDEQQDTSALLDAVCKRLVIPSQWVYLVGDPFQSVYGFAGSDAAHFMNWPIVEGKRRILSKSYRVPRKHWRLAESIIKPNRDWFDRGIEPADRDGSIDRISARDDLASVVDPTQEWLVLARTNYLASTLSAQLDRAGIPWRPTRGRGGYDAPKKMSGIMALYELQRNGVIDGERWATVLDLIPSTFDGQQLLTRGTKKRFESSEEQEYYAFATRETLVEMGATRTLLDMIDNGSWTQLVPDGAKISEAAKRYGIEAVVDPKIRVGTIHSVKGTEADNTYLLTTVTKPTVLAMEDREGMEEERRLWYVGTTRAREKLVIADDHRQRRFEIPA